MISKETARRLTRCLTNVVDMEEATGNRAHIPGLSIAGKTGTAEKIDPETRRYLRNRVVASFIGFFPAEAPELLCLVVLDEPKKFHTGGMTAAPIFHDITVRLLHCQDLPYGGRVFALSHPDSSTGFVSVPRLEGLKVDSALTLCRRLSLNVHLEGMAGKVTDQSLRPEMRVRKGERIRLVAEAVSDSTQSARMPDLLGLPIREALSRLRELGVPVKVEGTGFIRSQVPAQGEPVMGKCVCRLIAG